MNKVLPLSILLMYILLFQVITTIGAMFTVWDSGNEGDTALISSYDPHSPFVITSNAGFGSAGFSGNGSQANPYTLENVSMTLSGGTGISISDTTAYFLINNSLFMPQEGAFAIGIKLTNVMNGQVDSCVFTGIGIGIQISGSTSCSLTNITVDDHSEGVGVDIGTSSYCEMKNSTIQNMGFWGVRVNKVNHLNLSDNLVEDCSVGIHINQGTDNSFIRNSLMNNGFDISDSWSDTYVNNTVNERPVGYITGLTDQHIDASLFGEILVGECNNVTLANGIVSNTNYGVQMESNTNCTLWNITVSDNDEGIKLYHENSTRVINCTIIDNDIGLNLDCSYDITVENNTFYGTGILIDGLEQQWKHKIVNNTLNEESILYFDNFADATIDGSPYNQIILVDCTNVTIHGGTFHGGPIMFAFCTNCSISDCSTNGGYFGIRVEDSLLCNFTDVEVYDTQWSGIYLNYAENCTVQNCTLNNTQYQAINLDNSAYATITGNIVQESQHNGITISHSSNHTITNNTIYNSLYSGINLDHTEQCTITDNDIQGNGNGIWLGENTANINVYDNLVGWNSLWQGCDISPGTNLWDDDVSLGNYWGDYDGVGVYYLTGSAQAVDRYPRKADTTIPTIDSPDDVFIELGTSGYEITWHPSDIHPKRFWIQKGLSTVEEGDWNGSAITVDIDNQNLTSGVYEFKLTVYDTCSNSISDIIVVTVADTTAPVLNHPADITYVQNETGGVIIWTPTDLFPDTYEVLRNGTVVDSGVWSTTSIVCNVTGLAAGQYNYTIIVYDESGNSATDTVWITVVLPPSVFIFDPLLLIIFGALAVVVIVIIYWKNKK